MCVCVVSDTLDSIFDGDEDEEDDVIGQVLDEIGLEYTSKVKGVWSLEEVWSLYVGCNCVWNVIIMVAMGCGLINI